jgi:hypothetical protein
MTDKTLVERLRAVADGLAREYPYDSGIAGGAIGPLREAADRIEEYERSLRVAVNVEQAKRLLLANARIAALEEALRDLLSFAETADGAAREYMKVYGFDVPNTPPVLAAIRALLNVPNTASGKPE